MKRRIKPNHGCSVPVWHCCVDVETKPYTVDSARPEECHLLWFGMAHLWKLDAGRMTRQQWHQFDTAEQFWEWLYERLPDRGALWLWSHYAAYDLTALLLWREIAEQRLSPYLKRRNDPAENPDDGDGDQRSGMLVTDDPPTILDLQTRDGRRVLCLDLLNYLPASLAQIGESVGIAKSADPGDEATDEYWMERCRQDVRITSAAVLKLANAVKVHDLGNLRYTASGQSLALWRHRCMDAEITWGHDAYFKGMERESYYPGKLRAHYVGRARLAGTEWLDTADAGQLPGATAYSGPVYRLDINSCYPAVMRGNPYPVRYAGALEAPSLSQVAHYLLAYEACARVTVHSRDEAYPLRDKEGVHWRVGTFVTTLCGPDLRAALDRGHVKHVHALQYYLRGQPFDSFVVAVLALRDHYTQAGDKVFSKWAKTVANALHGKFAQWGGGWRSCQSQLPPLMWGTYVDRHPRTGDPACWRSIGGHAQLLDTKCEQPDSFPLIAAYVSAYARRLVQSAIDCAGAREVYYQDVDSIHVSAAGYDRLDQCGWIHPTECGKFKVEASVQTAEWRGTKNYRMGPHWTVSGVSPNARPDARGILCQTNFHRLNSLIGGEPPPGPITEEVPCPTPVPKVEGVIGPDGWLAYVVEGT